MKEFIFNKDAAITKRAPGTPALAWGELTNLLNKVKENKAHSYEIPRIPEEIIDWIRKNISFIDYTKIIENYLLKGKIRFVIDDISSFSNDPFLYPRQEALAGILSFTVSVYCKKDNLTQEICDEIDGRDFALLGKEEREAYQFKYYAVHITKAVLDMCAVALYDTKNNSCEITEFKEKGIEFLTQTLIHEVTETFEPPLKGVYMHRFGCLQEIFFATNKAKEKGISDLNLFFLEHALGQGNRVYLESLLANYDAFIDTSLGSFYDELCRILEVNKSQVMELPAKPSLRYDLFAKKSPGIQDIDLREYINNFKKQALPYKIEDISGEVTNYIKINRVGVVYDYLLELLCSKNIKLRIDDLNDTLYPVAGQPMGLVSFLSEDCGTYYIHITKGLYTILDTNTTYELSDGVEVFFDKIIILTQIVVYLYIENFLSNLMGINRHTLASLHSFLFSTRAARIRGVTDMDLFCLLDAYKNRNMEYFYYLLSIYDVRRDPSEGFKSCIYEILSKLERNMGGQLPLEKPEHIIPWYRYELETILMRQADLKRHNISISDIVRISRKLKNAGAINNSIKQSLTRKNKKYVLAWDYIDTKGETELLFLPADINDFEEMKSNFTEESLIAGYTKEDQTSIRAKHKRINKLRKEKKGEKHLTKKKAINEEVGKLSKEIVSVLDSGLVDYLTEEINFLRLQRPSQKCIVVGIMGASSSGTTTLADDLQRSLYKNGISSGALSSDNYLHPGEGFRFETTLEEGRIYHLEGCGMYSMYNYLSAIRCLKEGGIISTPFSTRKNTKEDRKEEFLGPNLEVLILECPFMGVYDEIREEIDIYIGTVFQDDCKRLQRRLIRDTIPLREGGSRGMTRNEVLVDLVKKKFTETHNATKHIVLDTLFMNAIWQQDTGKLYKNKYRASSGLSEDKKKLSIHRRRKELKNYLDLLKSKDLTLVFDLDSTLVSPGEIISDINAHFIVEALTEGIKVIILSTNSKESIDKLVLEKLFWLVPNEIRGIFNNLYIMPDTGTKVFEYNELVEEYVSKFEFCLETRVRNEIRKVLTEVVKEFKLVELAKKYRGEGLYPEEEFIEDRGTQIVLQVIGKHASLKEKGDYYHFCLGNDRKKIIEFINKRLRDEGVVVNIRLGGRTSIDIVDEGIDKGYGIDMAGKLGILPNNIVYIADWFGDEGDDTSVGNKGIGLVICVGDKQQEGLKVSAPAVVSEITGPEGAQKMLALVLDLRSSESIPNPYSARLRDNFIIPDAPKSKEEAAENYFEAAKAAFGLDYVFVDSTVSGRVSEYNETLCRIDILKELLARAPPYRKGTHATFAFQVFVNDIFRHETVHYQGDKNEDNAQAPSIANFRAHQDELLAYHNWIGVFGIKLDRTYERKLTQLEDSLFGPVSFKGAIFDNDGVIADTMWAHFEAWREILREQGIKLTREFFVLYMAGVRGKDVLDKLFLVKGDINAILAKRSSTYVRLIEEKGVEAFADTVKLIDELCQRNMKIAVASSGSRERTLPILEKCGVLNKFNNTIVTGDIIHQGKPYPEAFLSAAFELGLRAQECVVFEDAQAGVKAAKDGLFVCIGIDRDNAGLLGRADMVVKDLEGVGYKELEELFKGNLFEDVVANQQEKGITAEMFISIDENTPEGYLGEIIEKRYEEVIEESYKNKTPLVPELYYEQNMVVDPLVIKVPASLESGVQDSLNVELMYCPWRGKYGNVSRPTEGAHPDDPAKCVFCTKLRPDGILFKVKIGEHIYKLAVNILPWGSYHVLFISDDILKQDFSLRINDCLIFRKALGSKFSMNMHSLQAGASVPHFHAHIFREKLSIFDYLKEGNIKLEKLGEEKGVIEFKLSGWYCKAKVFTSSSLAGLNSIVGRYLNTLKEKSIPFGVLLNYEEDIYSVLIITIYNERVEVGEPSSFLFFGSVVDCMGRILVASIDAKRKLTEHPELVIKTYEAIQNKQSSEPEDEARPLPGQPMPTREEVNAEVASHDLNRFETITVDSCEVIQALAYLRSINQTAMADYLEYLAKAGLIRAVGQESIVLSNKYPAYNSTVEVTTSLIHEIGATALFNLSHLENNKREEELWGSFLNPASVDILLENLYSFLKEYSSLNEQTRNKRRQEILSHVLYFDNLDKFLPNKIKESIYRGTLFTDRFTGFIYWLNKKLFIPLGKILDFSPDQHVSIAQIINEAVIDYKGNSIFTYILKPLKGILSPAFVLGNIIGINLVHINKAVLNNQDVGDVCKYIFYEELRHVIDRAKGIETLGISSSTFLEDNSMEINSRAVENILNNNGFVYRSLKAGGVGESMYWLSLAKEFSGSMAAITFSDLSKEHLMELCRRIRFAEGSQTHMAAYVLVILEFYRAILRPKYIHLSDIQMEELLGSVDISEMEEAFLGLNSKRIRLLAKNEVYKRVFSIPLDEAPLPEILPDGSIKETISIEKLISLLDNKLFDSSRPLPSKPVSTRETVNGEVSRHDLNKFEVISVDSTEVAQALAYLCSINETAMADYLEYLAKAGLIRAGPLEGFLATTYIDQEDIEYLLLSNLYPEYNISFQRTASLVHEIGATLKFNRTHQENKEREQGLFSFSSTIHKDAKGNQTEDIPEDVFSILNNYDIGKILEISPLEKGHGIHRKFYIVCTSLGKYVVRYVREDLFFDTLEAARHEVAVINGLAQENLPVARIISKKTKGSAIKEDDFISQKSDICYLLYEYKEGELGSFENLTDERLKNLVGLLASIHNIFSKDRPLFERNYRPGSILSVASFRDRLMELKKIVRSKKSNDSHYRYSRGERFVLENIDFIICQIDLFKNNLTPFYSSLPRTVINGDFHPPQVVFDGDNIVGLFDWEHMREEARICDLAPMVKLHTDESSRFDLPNAKKLILEYNRIDPLTKEEIQVLPEMFRYKLLDRIIRLIAYDRQYKSMAFDFNEVPELERSIALIDKYDDVFVWYQSVIRALRDLDGMIRYGYFQREIQSKLDGNGIFVLRKNTTSLINAAEIIKQSLGEIKATRIAQEINIYGLQRFSLKCMVDDARPASDICRKDPATWQRIGNIFSNGWLKILRDEKIIFYSDKIVAYLYKKDDLYLIIRGNNFENVKQDLDVSAIHISLDNDKKVKSINMIPYSEMALSRSTIAIQLTDSNIFDIYPELEKALSYQLIWQRVSGDLRFREIMDSFTINLNLCKKAVESPEEIKDYEISSLVDFRYFKSKVIRRKALDAICVLFDTGFITPKDFEKIANLFLRADIDEDFRIIERGIKNNEYFIEDTFKNLFGLDISLNDVSKIKMEYVNQDEDRENFKLIVHLKNREKFEFGVFLIREDLEGRFNEENISKIIDNWKELSLVGEKEIPRFGSYFWELDYRIKKLVYTENNSSSEPINWVNNIVVVSHNLINDRHIKEMLSDSKFKAVIFDLDGVLISTAEVYFIVWKTVFDTYLKMIAERNNSQFNEFTREDYLTYVNGKSRYVGTEGFLKSRGITLEQGNKQEDAWVPGINTRTTVCGLANYRNILLGPVFDNTEIQIFEGSIDFIKKLKTMGIKLAIASPSKNVFKVLKKAGIDIYFDEVVCGLDITDPK
ncbi:MAG: HAD-IA family hydrolase, partial [Candidatus Omnitrophica bacterium]|nr:HAD-IA family hydrolase [Candidatus Omnitrophota bacterium]